MIRSETEYRESVRRLAEQDTLIKQQAEQLRAMKLTKAEIKRVLDPLKSFRDQVHEEVDSYERLRRGEFAEVRNFAGLGQLLVALRIANGLTQRELAERLQVSESQISRDERNEYHGVTVDRAGRVLEALGAVVTSRVRSAGKPNLVAG